MTRTCYSFVLAALILSGVFLSERIHAQEPRTTLTKETVALLPKSEEQPTSVSDDSSPKTGGAPASEATVQAASVDASIVSVTQDESGAQSVVVTIEYSGEGTYPVRYGLVLRNEDGKILDALPGSDDLLLSAGAPMEKTLVYATPSYVQEAGTLFLVVESSDGLIRALENVGEVSPKGEAAGSCDFSGETYTCLGEGNLMLTIHRMSPFGPVIKTESFTLPYEADAATLMGALTPGKYVLDVSLKGAAGEERYFHEVTKGGVGGTFLEFAAASREKDVLLTYAVSLSNAELSDTSVRLTLSDAQGKACGEMTEVALLTTTGTLTIPRACADGSLKAELVVQGTVTDTKNATVGNGPVASAGGRDGSMSEESGSGNSSMVFIGVALLFALVVLVLAYSKKKHGGSTIPMGPAALLIVGVGLGLSLFSLPATTHAATVNSGSAAWEGGEISLYCASYNTVFDRGLDRNGNPILTPGFGYICEKSGRSSLPAQINDQNDIVCDPASEPPGVCLDPDGDGIYEKQITQVWTRNTTFRLGELMKRFYSYGGVLEYYKYDSVLQGSTFDMSLEYWELAASIDGQIPGESGAAGCVGSALVCGTFSRYKTSLCDANEAMVGTRLYFGPDDQVYETHQEAQCAVTTGNAYGASAWVQASNAFADVYYDYKTVQCGANQLVTGIRMYGAASEVDDEHIDVRCTNVTNTIFGTPHWVSAPNAWGTNYSAYKTAACPIGEVMAGARWYQLPIGEDEEHTDILCVSVTNIPVALLTTPTAPLTTLQQVPVSYTSSYAQSCKLEYKLVTATTWTNWGLGAGYPTMIGSTNFGPFPDDVDFRLTCYAGPNLTGTPSNVDIKRVNIILAVPPAPSSFNAVPSVCDSRRINLSWNASLTATSYDVDHDGVIVNVGNSTSWGDTSLAPGSIHTYKVRARNATGASPWTTTRTVTAPAACSC